MESFTGTTLDYPGLDRIPPIMNLFDLPLELFQEIIDAFVLSNKLERTLTLRLVCRKPDLPNLSPYTR